MDAFQQLGNSAVQAQFADARTYIYNGKEVDQRGAPRFRPRDNRERTDLRRPARWSSTPTTSASTAIAW